MSTALTLFYGAMIFWLMTEAWIGLREIGRAITGKDRFSRIVIIGFVALGVYLSVTLGHKTHLLIFGSNSAHYLLGAIIIFLGVSFRIWAVLTLGKFFRTTVMVQEKHQVISFGPYKYLRHPSYSGVLMATLGVGIGIGNWLGLLALFLCIFIGMSYRIVIEEKVLSTELGKAYREYMKHTKKLIPFLY